MRRPSVHRNGSSRDHLLDGYTTAGQAVQDAIRALAECAPNARDYYPQSEGAFREACAEHTARIAHLQAVYAELADLAEGVADA